MLNNYKVQRRLSYFRFYIILTLCAPMMKCLANLETSLTLNRNSIPETVWRLSIRLGVCQSDERD